MKIRRIDLIVVIIVICVVICVIASSKKLFRSNNKVASSNDNITLIIKTPINTMSTELDSEVVDAYSFLEKASKLFKKQYKEANVDIKVVRFEQTKENSEIKECFGTNKAVDILYKEFYNMSTYIYTGRVVPLDDIITDEIRDDLDESYWKNSVLDGRTYMMPFLTMQNVLAYNKDLFRQVGLDKYIEDDDIVQNWSMEDWEIILKTLQEKLPDMTFPMMMYSKNSQGDTHIMTLLCSQGSSFFDENGKIKLTTSEGITGIEKIMEWNEKGYFPINPQNLEYNDCFDLFYNGQLAIFPTNISLDQSLKESKIDFGHVNFPSSKQGGLNTTFIKGFEVFDNGNSEKVKIAKDFVKFIYETDELLDLSTAGIPCSDKVYEKYKNILTEKKKYIDNKDYGWNFTGNIPNWRSVREVFYTNIRDLLYGEKTAEEIAIQIENTCNSAIEEGYRQTVLHK